jgi:hypothetical protein
MGERKIRRWWIIEIYMRIPTSTIGNLTLRGSALSILLGGKR